MNTARMLAWLVLPLAAVVAVGVLAIWLFKALLSLLMFVVVGALVVGGAVYLYGRARRAVAPGTRNRRRIDAAAQTYRTRNH
jgi:uncharacterized membrane protein YedE/YeeE